MEEAVRKGGWGQEAKISMKVRKDEGGEEEGNVEQMIF